MSSHHHYKSLFIRLSSSRWATPWSSTVFGAPEATSKALATREPVPDVMVTFGNPPNHMTFASHPGVMSVVKLLEMKFLVVPRAVLTQENVDAIREFDPVLADKCQLAVDAGIHINFMDIERINKPEFLQKFLHEKELLAMARKEVLQSPPGTYRIPYYAREWEKPEVPRKWRPEATISPEILAVEPDLIKDIELQGIVSEYLRNKPVDNEWEPELQDPIVVAAESVKADKTATPDPIQVNKKPNSSTTTAAERQKKESNPGTLNNSNNSQQRPTTNNPK